MSVKIIIATHKKYRMPDDSMYLPLHVGAEGKKDANGDVLELGYVKDNTGDNISYKNANFCELTGLYWAWKNLEEDYIGLVHYRRYFCLKIKHKDKFDDILQSNELCDMLYNYKIFVPQKRKYYIETLQSHYEHTHYIEHLNETRKIIEAQCPKYLPYFEKVMKQRSGYMFNMMIMKKELLDNYCTWLFGILFELENRINMPELSAFQGRFYGRVSEIIFNVWIQYQMGQGVVKKNEIKELPYIHIGKINWKRKITAFLKAKILHKKYESSF